LMITIIRLLPAYERACALSPAPESDSQDRDATQYMPRMTLSEILPWSSSAALCIS
jgi:hypothetical protein